MTLFPLYAVALLTWLTVGKSVTIALLTPWARSPARDARRVFPDATITPAQSRREWGHLGLTLTDASVLVLLIATHALRLGDESPRRILVTLTSLGLWAEVWFYWTHRWMHLTNLGWAIHQEHHRSLAVQPITATSFSFAEKLLIYTLSWALFLTALSRWMPVSLVAITIFYTYYFIASPLAHSNVEVVPASVQRIPLLGKVFSTAAGHAIHHARHDRNFGFQTAILDRLFGTFDGSLDAPPPRSPGGPPSPEASMPSDARVPSPESPAPAHGAFRVSRLDGIPLALAVLQAAGFAVGVLAFGRAPAWALWTLGASLTVLMFLNVNGLAHTLIHCGVLRSRNADAALGVVNGLALGLPQSIYHAHHVNHHMGNNDRKGLDGKTRDWSSTYRFSPTAEPENPVVYALLNLFRSDLRAIMHELRRLKRVRLLVVESVVLLGWLVALAVLRWRGFVFFYLPAFYAGWFLSTLDAYYKHWRVNADDRFANSASYYGRVYNWLTFNTGHHQEHHLRPHAHWTELPALRVRFASQMAAHGVRVIDVPHVLAFLQPGDAAGVERLVGRS